MKNNVVSSIAWLSTIILSLILLPLNTYLVVFSIGTIDNSFFISRFYVALIFSIIYGWGFIVLCGIFFLAPLWHLTLLDFMMSNKTFLKKFEKQYSYTSIFQNFILNNKVLEKENTKFLHLMHFTAV